MTDIITVILYYHSCNRMMPSSNSITLNGIENKLIYVTPNESEQKNTINNFVDKKGIIFKSIHIPIQLKIKMTHKIQ